MASEPKRRFVLAALASSILGMGLAGYLLWEHWHGGAMLGCSAGGTFDCESVNQSIYSEIRGIPVALWGVLAYFLSSVLLVRALTSSTPDELESPLGTVFLFALAAVMGDCVLFYAQAFVIGHWCLYCLASYVASIGLLSSCWMALGSPARVLPAIKKDWDQLGKAKPMGIGIAIFILIMIGYLLWKPLPSGTPTMAYLFNAPYNKGGPSIDLTNPFKPDPAITEIENAPFMDPGPGGGYAKGAANPVLTIVEFGDLECPACQHFSWTMDEFMEKHPNDVRWVFRHYPLDMVCNPNVHRKMHEFACSCARGAEAAGLQGKFWEMEHEIYSQTDDKGQFMPKRDLTDAGLEAKAAKVGVSVPKWKEDQASEPIMAKISDDVETGVHVGIESTPTLFINGRKISGGKDVKTLEKYLDLAKKGKLNPRGPGAAASPTTAASAP